ncbi:mandelate racemase/muconate lactonizing enzyme family protein [Nonomuraea sp. NPDC050536]|uniref:mandelate racemase/muconate lactonizing enzyme family protein n=1 Tax=Nonomuraea sp. NPDC050536 TaxID=3364366 RepID=UPI0037C7C0F5
MKVVQIETLRPRVQPNLLLVRLHTDAGLIGLGEAFFGARAVEAYLHETVAGALLGIVDPTPEGVAASLAPYVGYQGAGAETRGNGAIDMALWDLLGQQAGLPLARMLGGPVRAEIPIYNTCAGTGYVGTSTMQRSDNWGLPAEPGRYEDLHAFLNRPGELARELLAEGITAMKVWPFDKAAEAGGGTRISRAELAEGLAVIEAIRSEAGMAMDVMVELHGLWTRPAAVSIIEALTPLQPMWVEDPIRPDAVDALERLAGQIDVPIATGETCVGRRGFAPLLRTGVIDVATLDLQWSGGLTEARKVAALADCHGVPIAPHDCTGPVTLACAVHLVCSQPNGMIQETARAFLRTWYQEVAEGLPEVTGGTVTVPTAPGHGVRLTDRLLKGDEGVVERRVSAL